MKPIYNMENCRKTDARRIIQMVLFGTKFTQITLLLISTFSISSAQKIDSLVSLLDNTIGIDRSRIHNELAFEYLDIDNNLALDYGRRAFNAAKEYRDTFLIVESARIKSQAFDRLGMVDSTIELLNQVLPIATAHKFDNEIVKILNLLGLSFTYKAEYAKALQYHFQSLELREVTGDKSAISVSFNNLGLVYYKMKDYSKALDFYRRSLILKKEVKNLDTGTLLVNISLCYSYLNDFKQANKYVERAFGSCDGNCSKELLMYGSYSRGVSSLGLKNFKKAEREFLRSYALSKELNDNRLWLDNIIYLSKLYVSQNQLGLAEKYLRECQKLIREGVPYTLELIKVYRELFNLYSKSKNYEKVSAYQGLYIQLKDSVYSDELTRNLMKVEADYLERENRARIEAQNKILSLDKEVIFRQQIVNASVGAVAVLLILVSYVLIRSNRRKRLMNQLLELKVKERTIELEQNQLTLLKALDERTLQLQKVSTEVKGSIATIRGLCSLASIDPESSPSVQYLDRIEKTANGLIRNLNSITF